jgi:hypothetical protein
VPYVLKVCQHSKFQGVILSSSNVALTTKKKKSHGRHVGSIGGGNLKEYNGEVASY